VEAMDNNIGVRRQIPQLPRPTRSHMSRFPRTWQIFSKKAF